MTAAFLELGGTGGQVELVMHDEYRFGSDFVKAGDGRHCPAAGIHEGRGLEQPAFVSLVLQAAGRAEEFALGIEPGAMRGSNLIHPPEARVVARGFVLGAGIAQTYDQLDTVHARFECQSLK